MRIAATLAGALLGVLLMLPVAAHAGSTQANPRLHQQQFDQPGAALMTAEPHVTREDDDSAELDVKKRKKPQFQTRFFSE